MAVDAATCDGNMKPTAAGLCRTSVPRPFSLSQDSSAVRTRPTCHATFRLDRRLDDWLRLQRNTAQNISWNMLKRMIIIVIRGEVASQTSYCGVKVFSSLNWTPQTASPRISHRLNKAPFCSNQFFPLSVVSCFFFHSAGPVGFRSSRFGNIVLPVRYTETILCHKLFIKCVR